MNLLALISFAGVVVSSILSQHFNEVRSGTAAFKSFCNLGATMNCDVVAASRFAEVVAGLPLSSFAAGWFLGAAILAIVGRNAFWRREALRALAAMYLFGFAMSGIYLMIMMAQLQTYCLFCLIVDVLNFAGLATVFVLKPEGLKEHALDRKKWKTFAGVVGGSVAVMVFSLHLMAETSAPKEAVDDAVQSTLSTPVLPVGDGEEFPSFGAPKGAPITIVEFSDLQCPHCRHGAKIIGSVVASFPNVVRVVFRNYPLDANCNPAMTHGGHPVACEAARVALCAQNQGKFLPVYEEIFEKQESLEPGKPAELAKSVGVDATALAACTASSETAARVGRDIEEGNRLGVKSTPTFFINGHKVEGALPVEVWQKIVRALLKK